MKIHIVLDNIRSVFNVGSIFRTADGAGSVEKIYLCGMTTPIDNPKLEKTALGATEMIASEHYDTTQEALVELREKNIPIYSVELTDDAQDFQKVEYPEELALVFGHEKNGVEESILEASDKKIYIPMRGKKESLNVANCASIILYEITRER
ncbi:MAG: tRNA/rRNA methyltransferase [candidate division WS6 bacterium GW2011_GWF1_35_23]|uniref:tRNA/rRNA methyltransferase n=1 Tax=candidate division WS6 bacterium GW2011_GWF1_35_23 TaxID=1619097 RepID=A0A0G0F5D9_9BACT|nr:MAG: tRNA/rRNA methyltransferase [candidate division WS6 bacterium GW2011_GWF1_35_23]